VWKKDKPLDEQIIHYDSTLCSLWWKNFKHKCNFWPVIMQL
jgi:hypothetical protein